MTEAPHTAVERRNIARKLLERHGQVTVSDLSERLGVSEVTIRKDLSYLEDRNLLLRTHGGAVLPHLFGYNRPFKERATQHSEEKRRIGEKAASLVKDDGDTLILDAGTTTIHIARNLGNKHNLMVITNAVNVALELVTRTNAEVFMLGGMLRSTSASVVGPFAEEMLKQHSCSKLFLGVDGFDIDYGLTTNTPMEAHVNQLMIEAAQKTIVVTDSSKFGRRSLSRTCSVDTIDTIITDKNAPESIIQRLEDIGIECILV